MLVALSVAVCVVRIRLSLPPALAPCQSFFNVVVVDLELLPQTLQVRHGRQFRTANDQMSDMSGEALTGDGDFGIDPQVLNHLALEIGQLRGIGVQVGLVLGGGNLFRGEALSQVGLDRVAGDHMGMLATVMNGLAMRDVLERSNITTILMSAIQMTGVVEQYDRRKAIRHLRDGDVVIFVAGTGNPFFTTDSAACLRGIEVQADAVFKATKVDGVYNTDPMKDSAAVRYDSLTYDQVLDKKLGVMDLTAICLCRDHDMPLRVFNMKKSGALLNVTLGGNEGTLIEKGN